MRPPAPIVVTPLAIAHQIAAYRQQPANAAVTTSDLLLALIVDPTSQSAVLVRRRGGGTYTGFRKDFDTSLPAPELLTHMPAPSAVRAVSVRRWFTQRLVAGTRWMVAHTQHVRNVREALHWEADLIRVNQVALDIATTTGRPAAPEHYLLALTLSAGRHRWLIDEERMRVIGAEVRRALGLGRGTDRLLLMADWPAFQVRRTQTAIWGRPRNSPPVVLAKAAWLLTGAFVGFIVLFAEIVLGFLLFGLVLLPAIIFSNFIRYVVGACLRTEIRLRRFVARPGGIVDVTSNATGRRAVATILLPRVITFVVGTIVLAMFYWHTRTFGSPMLPAITSRPDLLTHGFESRLPSSGAVLADALTAHGVVAGTAFVTGLGCLALSVPSHHELLVCQLHLSAAQTRTANIIRSSLTPMRALTGATESLETMLLWRNGPLWATTALVPLITGALFASLIASILVHAS